MKIFSLVQVTFEDSVLYVLKEKEASLGFLIIPALIFHGALRSDQRTKKRLGLLEDEAKRGEENEELERC